MTKQIAELNSVNVSHPDRIRLALQKDIEAGVLRPGTSVDEKELADRFGVSRTPVREALLSLAALNLVRIVPRSGIQVYAPAPAELVSMLEALAEFEAVAVRLSTLRMDQGQRDRVRQLCIATGEAARDADRLGYERSNQLFHEALYQGCGNEIVVEEIRQLRLRLAAFRRKVRDQPGRLLSAAAEHAQIIDALMMNNAELAAQAMREHVLAKGRAFADLLLGTPAASTAREEM